MNILSELSVIKINVDKNFVSFFMSAVNSLLWCFQYSKNQKRKKLNDSTSSSDNISTINSNDVIDDDSYTSSDDDDYDDDDDDDDDDITDVVLVKSDGSVDENAISAKDEYLNSLKKEFNQSGIEGQSDDMFDLGELPVIKTALKLDRFAFNMEGVAKMEVHKVVVCSHVETESKSDNSNSNNTIMDSLLAGTYTVEFSLGSVNLISMIPSAYKKFFTCLPFYLFTFYHFYRKGVPLLYSNSSPFIQTK